jgi:hypothetical protein
LHLVIFLLLRHRPTAAGDELDAMDDATPHDSDHDHNHPQDNPQVQVYRTFEGTDTTPGHTTAAAAAPPATPSNGLAGAVTNRLAKLGGLLVPHVPEQQQQGRRWLQGWELGPGAAPAKGKDDEDGTDMLLFSDDYDEFEYDFEASSSSDDEGADDDESAGWEGDSAGEEEGEEEDIEDVGFGGLGEGGVLGGGGQEGLAAALWQQQQQQRLQEGDDEADDMDVDDD